MESGDIQEETTSSLMETLHAILQVMLKTTSMTSMKLIVSSELCQIVDLERREE